MEEQAFGSPPPTPSFLQFTGTPSLFQYPHTIAQVGVPLPSESHHSTGGCSTTSESHHSTGRCSTTSESHHSTGGSSLSSAFDLSLFTNMDMGEEVKVERESEEV